MTGWLITAGVLAAYAAVGALVAPRAGRAYAAYSEREYPATVNANKSAARRGAARMGGLAGFFWPPLLFAWAIKRGLEIAGGGEVALPSDIAEQAKRHEAERRQMKARIAELERELGIGRNGGNARV